MARYITRKLFYGVLVMLGVVVTVFFLFQGFGDPSRLVMGQRAGAATQIGEPGRSARRSADGRTHRTASSDCHDNVPRHVRLHTKHFD